MIKFVIGFIVGIFVALVSGYIFITHGLSMSAKANPLPMESFLANRAIHTSVGQTAQQQSPLPADEKNLLAGAAVYQHNGSMGCHGRG